MEPREPTYILGTSQTSPLRKKENNMSLATRLNEYETTFLFHIKGIPCYLAVTSYVSQPAWKKGIESCPSSDDYYGYEEISFDILDTKGYRARWLEAAMKPSDHERANELISNYYKENGSRDEP
jgi:hypothetical protein